MAETAGDTELASIARELYAHVPAEFVAARNARAAELRRKADKDLAKRVKALPKATAAAWAVGAVVREEPGEVDALSELGAELRVAQAAANPAELRTLGKRRRQLTGALTRTAARIADERGVPLSAAARDQAEATWQAAVIDPDAERAVRSLLLVRALEPGGSASSALAVPGAVPGTADDAGATPVPLRRVPSPAESDENSAPASSPTRSDDDGAPTSTGRRADEGAPAPSRGRAADADASSRSRGDVARQTRRAERELRARVRAAEQALTDLEEAEEEHARVEARVLQVAARIEELRRELEEREDELSAVDEERAVAQEEREDAADRAAAARRAVEEARARLAELSG